MEIDITRDDEGVVILVTPGKVEAPFEFRLDEGPGINWDEMLVDYLTRCLAERIEEDRRDLYEEGWEDAKKRKKKKTQFSSCINEYEQRAWED